jgi:hypothetical protein
MNITTQTTSNTAFAYFQRNKLWLMPLLGSLVILLAPHILLNLFPNLQVPLSPWLPNTMAFLGFAVAGFGAVKTDTLSALVFARLAIASLLLGLCVLAFQGLSV